MFHKFIDHFTQHIKVFLFQVGSHLIQCFKLFYVAKVFRKHFKNNNPLKTFISTLLTHFNELIIDKTLKV